MNRKMWVAGLVAALLVFPGIGYSALIELSITDSSSGVGNGTVYNLEINSLGGNSYSGSLDAITISNPNWYIGWWTLKLDAGSWTGTGPTGNWGFATGPNAVDLVGANNWPQNHRNGSYVAGVVDDGSVDKTQGALLNGNTYSWDFTFTSSDLSFDELPFQVGYFNPQTSSTPRLSQTFRVPEPAALILVGVGLIGLAGFGRKKFRK